MLVFRCLPCSTSSCGLIALVIRRLAKRCLASVPRHQLFFIGHQTNGWPPEMFIPGCSLQLVMCYCLYDARSLLPAIESCHWSFVPFVYFCWMLAVGRLILAVCGWVLDSCSLLPIFVSCLLSCACAFPFSIECLLLAICCYMFAIRCLRVPFSFWELGLICLMLCVC